MPSTRNKVQPQNISHEHELDSKGVYGWVFGLKNMVTIESPQSVVDGMKEMLAAVEKRYEDSKGLQ